MFLECISLFFVFVLFYPQVASWISFLLWIILVLVGITHLVSDHKNTESDQVPFVNTPDDEHDAKA